ncbi:MAG TPA: MarR family winged helix-turn-helix transcriptional regulator [Patescibacteria group bacterium]|nr:MarR family winged helix-turn-helix transcriptional regulator [Patescibacteria group bacterium]
MFPVNNIIILIEHLGSVLEKQINELFINSLEIGYSQYRILLVIEWNPHIEQKEIAKGLGQTEASISRQIKVLIKKGLLIIKKDDPNKRRKIAIMTPAGMKVSEAASTLLRQNFIKDINNLGKYNINQVTESLRSIHQSICRSGKVGSCSHLLAN